MGGTIAFVVDTNIDDGQLGLVLRGLATRGDHPDVYLLDRPHDGVEALPDAARVVELPGGWGPRGIAALRRDLRVAPADVVHAYGLRAGLAALLARPPGTPLVVTWPSAQASGRTYAPQALAQRGLARSVLGAAEVTFATSATLAKTATALGARDVRVALPPWPVPPPSAAPVGRAASEVRAEFGLTAEQPLIFSAAHLHPAAHVDVLVAAAARWRTLTPVPTVVVVGTGPAYRRLAAQAAVARAPVILLGKREDAADLLGAADIVVVTAAPPAEGDGAVTAAAALTRGVALVCVQAGAAAELAAEAAVRVPPGDVDALDAAVRGLLNQPELRAQRVAAGSARARGWPSAQAVAEQVISVYDEIHDRAPQP